MKFLRRSSRYAVVAAWLHAELDSPRFGHHLRLGDVDRGLIARPDLNDPAENALRRQLLAYRDDILMTIPDDAEWWEGELAPGDLARLFAINYPAWEIYSGGTGRLVKVAEALRDGPGPTSDNSRISGGLTAIQENVGGIYRDLTGGRAVGPLILLGRRADGPFTVIEGNKRAAALCWRHCLDGIPCAGLPALAGITPRPCPWLSPHMGQVEM